MANTDTVEIRPTGPLRATIRPPGSKSITNRALVCAALAEGESVLTGALDSEDTRVMIEALRRLGIAVEHDPAAASGPRGRLRRKSAGPRGRFVRGQQRHHRAVPHGHADLGPRHLPARRHAADASSARSKTCWWPCGNSAATRFRNWARAARRWWFGPRAAGRPGHGGRRHFQPVPQRPADGGALCRRRRGIDRRKGTSSPGRMST